MIKAMVSGVWVGAVTLASAYAGLSWQTARPTATEAHKVHGGVETVRTRMISVPVIADGALQGYVMAQFAVTVDGAVAKGMSVKPDLYIQDEAFKTIYAEEAIDFRQIKRQDLAGLSKKIAENVNKRLGSHVVADVLIQELNYLTKESVRGGLKQR